MADYSTPPKKAKRSLSGAATYKSRFKKDGTKLYPVSKYKIHRENFVAMFVPVLCVVLTPCRRAYPSEEIKGFKTNEDIKQLWFQKTRRYFERIGNS